MPEFRVPPVSIVNQIRNNLQDRCETGFPVLKELLQNADDSRAKRFRVEALSGWKEAVNPLLRWPGLLAVNDGVFREEDEGGIISFGDSSKAADSAAIGKFGFGQKAVFHICDAFAVYAYDASRTFSCIVNPFLNVEVTGNVSDTWEPSGDGSLADADLERLRRTVSPDFPDRGLLLWFPFRTAELRPAPDVGFSTNLPLLSQTIAELVRPDDLAVIIAALRHLERVEIRDDGATRCAVYMDRACKRLLGPMVWQSGHRHFRGTISVRPGQTARNYVGREATRPDGRAAQLKCSPFWPKSVSVLDPHPKPEKGEPHGAVTMLRTTTAPHPTLRISWAVFLPISETHDIDIPLGDDVSFQVRLLLHGYFFLDSGRRSIEGLDDARAHEEPTDAGGLRRAWNTELRDSVVLPLVTTVLSDALDSKIFTSAQLAELVRSIAKHSWFASNRRAICGAYSLVRTFEAPGQIAWRTPSSEASLLPLPQAVATAPKRIEELFPGIHAWASARNAVLCVDKDASLTAKPMRWIVDDLDTLFAALSPRAFQAGAFASLLAEFLALIERNDADRQVIGPHIVAALRQAMGQSAQMARSQHLAEILAWVPDQLLFPLPASVEHRQILKALAAARASVLPVRAAWLGDFANPTQLPMDDLKPLLEALEPHLAGARADQAAVAALACLTHAAHRLSELSNFSDLAPIKVLRAREVRTGTSNPISLEVLLERSPGGPFVLILARSE